MNCSLKEYSSRAEGVSAPLASDRCTVFMERDLNYYLSENYSTEEVLASVLHSVRENYLTKVAIEKNIGNRIFFQGATARNRALVAAFEQRLGRPIMVSRFCHLTGALGAALHMKDAGIKKSSFRGLELFRESIPLKSEVCDLCNNNCKIKLATVAGDTVAFGFLCGRDYETRKYVNENTSGFDLLKERKKLQAIRDRKQPLFDFIIGIPAALHLMDDLYLWKHFFNELGIRVITSAAYRDGIREGKKIAGAEFCAPVTEIHGHALYLQERADYVFLPISIEEGLSNRKVKRNYCYYTHFVPSLISSLSGVIDPKKILSPMAHSVHGTGRLKKDLYGILKELTGNRIRFSEVSAAYDRAAKANEDLRKRFNELYRAGRVSHDINVILLGRPYTILSPSMNKGVPEIFGKQGVTAFFQDMIDLERHGVEEIDTLLNAFHWLYASRILEIAETVAKTRGLYPVLVTSFKCTPDAYTVDYFKRIMEAHHKPYLILQLDEHDSNVGYETRIEAGIRSFRNHFSSEAEEGEFSWDDVVPEVSSRTESMKEKVVLLPRWDGILGQLMPAVLKREGIDARLVEETTESIQRSLSHNTGQCIPLNIIVQDCIDYVLKNGLDPEKTLMWNVDSKMACNLGMFPYYCKTLLESYGRGMEKIEVYTGDITFIDLKISTALTMYLAYMLGGMLRRLGCRVRPYEVIPGSTDRILDRSISMLVKAFEDDLNLEKR